MRLKIQSTLCTMAQQSSVHSSRVCREAHKVSTLIFADWEAASDRFMDSNILLTLNKIRTLDQWHASVNSILLKRTWDSDRSVITSLQEFDEIFFFKTLKWLFSQASSIFFIFSHHLKGYVKSLVSEIRQTYSDELWAQTDSRFLFLQWTNFSLEKVQN